MRDGSRSSQNGRPENANERREDFVQRNCPTQAKTGLEWATRRPWRARRDSNGIRRISKVSVPTGCVRWGLALTALDPGAWLRRGKIIRLARRPPQLFSALKRTRPGDEHRRHRRRSRRSLVRASRRRTDARTERRLARHTCGGSAVPATRQSRETTRRNGRALGDSSALNKGAALRSAPALTGRPSGRKLKTFRKRIGTILRVVGGELRPALNATLFVVLLAGVNAIPGFSSLWALPPQKSEIAHPSGPSAIERSVLTQHNDNARTGAYLVETQLNPSTVNQNTFGRLYERAVDGQIIAQPLYLRSAPVRVRIAHPPGVSGPDTAIVRQNVVYVVTRNNTVYAFDADETRPDPFGRLWSRTLHPAAEVPQMCAETWGPMGITSTPVIDPVTETLFVVARDGNVVNGKNNYWLHALQLSSGEDRADSPLLINTNGFNPNVQLNRPGLLLVGGSLVIAFGTLNCDVGNDVARNSVES